MCAEAACSRSLAGKEQHARASRGSMAHKLCSATGIRARNCKAAVLVHTRGEGRSRGAHTHGGAAGKTKTVRTCV